MAEVWVMAPMITSIDEVRGFAEPHMRATLPIIGVMIETPAAALQADQILAEKRPPSSAREAARTACEFRLARVRPQGPFRAILDG